MKAREAVEKYRIELIGKDTLKVQGKLSKEEATEIKGMKTEIINTINAMKKEAREARKAQFEAEKENYLQNAKLVRVFVVEGDDYGNESQYITTLEERNGNLYTADYGVSEKKEIKNLEIVEVITEGKQALGYGAFGAAYIISDTEEAALLEANEEKKEEEAQEKKEAKVAEEERANSIFKIARDTGKPTVLRQWNEPCDGTVRECNMDIITEYAMPDGSVFTKRIHTH